MPSKRKTRSNAAASSAADESSKKLKSSRETNGQVDEEAVASVTAEKVQTNSVDAASSVNLKEDGDSDESTARFLGEPVPDEEARQRWPQRYQGKKMGLLYGSNSKCKDDYEEVLQARCHYLQAEVDGCSIYNLYDDAHVKAEEGDESYICNIVEMFEAVDGKLYFSAQWYYRAKDTVIKDCAGLIEAKRVFFSEVRDDNPLDCLVEKLSIARVPLNMTLDVKCKAISASDYYTDMCYLLPYSSFVRLPSDLKEAGSETLSTISSEIDVNGRCQINSELEEVCQVDEHKEPEVTLLDIYSGCGAMSTGLCIGANLSGLNLVTKWAIDFNEHACESLKLNHPETEVRNESAENFLSLIKEWEKLCIYFSLIRSSDLQQQYVDLFNAGEGDDVGSEDDGGEGDEEVFEVSNILAVCYGDPNQKKTNGLYFKVSWKGYGSDADTWEPVEGLSNCRERIKGFVTQGFKSKILPLPGDVDVICGGPPCQGISGFNRFRNVKNPLDDVKNEQLVVYMDLVNYLNPKFVLMENVVDLIKFSNGYLGRYALGRLVAMNYQTRMGMMAAGAYGLPQFRMRVFIWAARPTEKLPQFPLPTHDVVVRGVIPVEFEMNTVAYDEGHTVQLQQKLLLEDAISDLPLVDNYERRDEIPYGKAAQTEFQQFIRLSISEMLGSPLMSKPSKQMLYDHRPLELNGDDYDRVCQIPKKKGANFRDLPGVLVRGNKVEWDPDVERVYLKSGKPLVPEYAMTFVRGTSSKPFARLWWDETVPTVVTRAEPHNQAILHPEQDRVLSVRENARLQGFPDYYKLCGPIKARYIQVGNAVAVPVARALGYALGFACQGSASNDPLFTLPQNFPIIKEPMSSASSEDAA
ncbi:Cytosine-specific methyltransferase [Quillaja saponaria]|uniref:DNA (cytosine-5-)-methyltransferase n=1 Tax=Quillaja saponaria TaxID=32244 RepID=A0AAD7Q2S1_QUISA|nr:Cytosine-specific methyltransferase [Quillaja saponaria]